MTITKIRKALDDINSRTIGEYEAMRIWNLEEAWSAYNGKNLGEMRNVIEDRLHLAHSRRVRAGY